MPHNRSFSRELMIALRMNSYVYQIKHFKSILKSKPGRLYCNGEALSGLRSLAHIIDMHQLSKSPDRLATDHAPTTSSPANAFTTYELGRYLDYCTEMLSLTGKIAALYIQHFEDGVALAAVNEIEDLTTGLSRKIWQKMVSLPASAPERAT